MTPLRKAVALLNMGLEVALVRRHLFSMGLAEGEVAAVLEAAKLTVRA
jgi:hypothetical protein